MWLIIRNNQQYTVLQSKQARCLWKSFYVSSSRWQLWSRIVFYYVFTNYPTGRSHSRMYRQNLSRNFNEREFGRRWEESETSIHTFSLLRVAHDDNSSTVFSFQQTWSQYGSTFSLHTPEEALYVYECVEMELGLFYNDNDSKYTCPINLHGDRENRSR